MASTPCEQIRWDGLPALRKELAKNLVEKFGISQKEAAEKLGLTPAAVCQYLSKKRGRLAIVDEKILHEVTISAVKIIEEGEPVVSGELCRLCMIIRKNGILSFNVIK
jgi:predicted transcriptional regulator